VNHSNLFALLALAIVGGLGYKVYTEYVQKTPKTLVDVDAFNKLEIGMGKPAAEALLGPPQRTTRGRVVAIDVRYSPDIHFAIDERNTAAEELDIYEGQNNERILILYSKDGKAIAAEYALGHSAVLYKGQDVAESKTPTDLTPRVEQNEQEAADVAQFYRRLQQKQQAAAPKPPPAPAQPQQSPAAIRPETCPEVAKAPAEPPVYRPEDAPKFRLTLPSGAVLSNMMMDVPANWQDSNLPASTQVHVIPYPSGAVHGVFAVKDGRCHGASASLYPGGGLCTLAYYQKGQLVGQLRLWAPDHTRLLYAEYANGQRHGPLCFFAGDVPCLLQEWQHGKLEAEYFVQNTGLIGAPIPKSELSAESNDGRQFAAQQQQLQDLLAEVEGNERTLKQNIAKWYREECERSRRQQAASQTSAKRDAIIARTGARNAAKAAAWQAQLQRALRTWP
jgi:hypothetical protein